jgi:hypothetical protein
VYYQYQHEHEAALAWLTVLLMDPQDYAAIAFKKPWLRRLEIHYHPVYKSMESLLSEKGYANIVDCADSRWYKSVSAEASARNSSSGISIVGGMQWIGGVLSKAASSSQIWGMSSAGEATMVGTADAGDCHDQICNLSAAVICNASGLQQYAWALAQDVCSVTDVLCMPAEASAAPHGCILRHCYLAAGLPESITADPGVGEAGASTLQRLSFQGSLGKAKHEFNLHVTMTCCATEDEVHVKLVHLEGQLSVLPAADRHRFGMHYIRVQLHLQQHKAGLPLMLSPLNLGEPATIQIT